MLKEFFENPDIIDKELFKSQLADLQKKIKNKFSDFDLIKHSLLIKDYLILRNAISSQNLGVSKELELFKLFDGRHTDVIDDAQVNNVLKFVTEITATPNEEKGRV